MNSLLVIITSLLVDTAATTVSLQGHYGQATMPLAGTQVGGFSVGAQSVYDINTTSRVFGEAGYSWGQSEGNKWVENADYDLLYPYLTCDTIGGGLRSEQYFFRGGYRMNKQHIIWHLALQYRALQSYRSVDPRPKNKVADLRVDGSVGYTDGHYAYSVMGQIGRYKQNNDITFYSELGDAMLFHLVQPNEDYSRFAGAFKSAYYHGLTAGTAFMVQPTEQGFLAGLDYQYMRVTEELSSTTAIPIAALRTYAIHAQIGYNAPLWRLSAQGGYTLRRGTQYLYGEVANQYYNLLLKTDNYSEYQWHIGASGYYNILLPIGRLTLNGELNYLHKLPQSATTAGITETTDITGTTSSSLSVQFSQLASYLTAAQLTATLSLRYASPIHGRYAWFFQPSAHYTHYFSAAEYPLSATTFRWQVSLSTGVTF